jgi:aspartate/methionine/tyrosine aminotransferase
VSGCRALLLNYPNNPTAAVADDAFWRRALAFAERHDLLWAASLGPGRGRRGKVPSLARSLGCLSGRPPLDSTFASTPTAPLPLPPAPRLINDNPYIAQVYGGSGLAASALAQPGAKARTVELFSFAKSYQLGGFRLGFALGNADAIAALEDLKAPIDFNQ